MVKTSFNFRINMMGQLWKLRNLKSEINALIEKEHFESYSNEKLKKWDSISCQIVFKVTVPELTRIFKENRNKLDNRNFRKLWNSHFISPIHHKKR